MLIRSLVYSILVILIGCSDSEDMTTDRPTSESSSTATPDTQPSTSQATKSEPPQPIIETPAPSATTNTPPIDAPHTTSTKKTIDLSLPDDWDTHSEHTYEIQEHQLLPNLFPDQAKEQDIQLDGKLLNDETTEDYMESIEGAEVSVEFKLD